MTTVENIDQVISTTTSNPDFSILSLVMSSDLISKIVMLILLLSSCWSWGIIIYKLYLFTSIKRKMKNFEEIFWSGQILNDLYERVRRTIDNPLSHVFVSAIEACKTTGKSSDSKNSDALKLNKKERMLSAVNLAQARDITALEQQLPFLATISSSAPFIGLFGTVWGIMHSFQSIAASKNTTLAVVAPGIAEALFATAVGLFVAIPATIFYNYLSSEIGNIDNRIGFFTNELNDLLSTAIYEEKI